MLRHSFIHMTRIGRKTERRLWQAGIVDWPGALDTAVDMAGLGIRRWDLILREADESLRRWSAGEIAWFANRLGGGEAWRLFGELHEHAAYLDIETTGMGQSADVTAVVVHRAGQTMFFVRDENLHELPLSLVGVKLLVTYNGKCFDWPILRAAFANLPEPAAHLDLRTPFARLNFRGGLKGIERAIGLQRPAELAEVDGASAVWLWHRHCQGDRRAMPALLRYCAEDVLNLKYLAEWVHNTLVRSLPIEARQFDAPSRSRCETLPHADPELMEECRRGR
ncbi:MAG: ribonuclease H-like domain-containing protein, partial [Phycisphaerae bacterium]|nr:ribonuclease H-like domain-containing protein [Phycisphaerae bacterium]